MRRLRLLLLLSCVGALVGGGSALACVAPEPAVSTPSPTRSGSALALLERAAVVSRTTSWRGTQSVVQTRGDMPRYHVRTVEHAPGAGSSVVGVAGTGRAVTPDLLDDDLFALLTRNYQLAVVGPQLCDGRQTVLVEARRPGQRGRPAVAGRFWVDDVTQMVWRRDVLDERGSVVVSAAFSELAFATPPASARPVAATAVPSAARLDDRDVRQLVEEGWPVVDHLPDGLERFEALRHDDGVLQLSYSDGLSTLSLFVQRGSLPKDPGGTVREIGGNLVHVTSLEPEQLVWSGAGLTWTLVSDAGDSTIADAVLVLPHADAPPVQEGMGDRVWRGMSRVGAWLNPFD